MNRVIIFVSAILAIFQLNQNTNSLDPSQNQGYYRINCSEGSGYIQILNDSLSIIEVNSNQIYIQTKHSSVYKDKIHKLIFYYDQPTDLGRGGLSLPWNHYSSEKPIAEAILNNGKELEFIWFGFFNKETENVEWNKKMDFFNSEKLIYPFCLKKCE